MHAVVLRASCSSFAQWQAAALPPQPNGLIALRGA